MSWKKKVILKETILKKKRKIKKGEKLAKKIKEKKVRKKIILNMLVTWPARCRGLMIFT